ncbi:drug/metabolite transporter superfamily protein YnfA [Actinoplanes lutulentus]|uniref:Uncharacterized protein DUF2029 n=1 Tax=Actinoplanes lutulentus TaxID=1287878 RepID=A0A327ZJY9_9ACTN|nr:glycosyltransferase family 87 protein [Actinoplanes lutulentus]MBB2944222.1 drug/metabolite transporter superfamily protein YnfA [Actinoplanes lutulentus]RAK42545.1 uncharacterized protein DUF2029 [Actinoplanes lutulentus]
MDRIRRVPGTALVALAAFIALSGLIQVLQVLAMGIDFEPLRNAATSLLHGESVFTDPYFVYPPTAVPLLLPTALGDPYTAFALWTLAGGAALACAAWLAGRQAEPDSRSLAAPGRRAIITAVALLSLLGGFAASRSLSLGNLTVFLVPAVIAILLAFHRGRWTLGCAILAATLLVKPMLAPLILVPLLHRRWSALARTMIPAGALLLAAMALIPGGSHYPEILRYVVSGTNLHGANAINNLSLRGWAEAHAWPHLTGIAAAAATSLILGVRVMASLTSEKRPSPVWLGTLVLVGTLLAGGISEVHYLLVVLAAILLLLALQPAGSRAWIMFTPGITLLAIPGPYVPMLLGQRSSGQTWFVLAELLLFTALLTMHRSGRGVRRPGGAGRPGDSEPEPASPTVSPHRAQGTR